MTVLVTGGSGLLGSHVILALRARGVNVCALVRPGSRGAVEALGAEPLLGEVFDPKVWSRLPAGISGIVHAAALVTQREPRDRFLTVNVGGTKRAIETARAARIRLVHISSVAVYGRSSAYRAGPGAVREDFLLGPILEHDYYAQSKRLAEESVWEAVAQGLEAVVIRPNVIYGEYDRTFSPRVVHALRQGFAPQVGAGTNRLSCVYAGNVAAAVVLALDSPAAPGKAFNTTDDGPEALTQRGFTDAFADAMGVRVLRVRLPFAAARVAVGLWARWQMLRSPGSYPGVGGAAVQFLAEENPFVAERARQELGWRPPTPPREAVARTVRWLLENEKPGR
jgi:nucleoside-diphosphate-sugar epimerase